MRKLLFSQIVLSVLFLLLQISSLIAQPIGCDPPMLRVSNITTNSALVGVFSPNLPIGYEVSYSFDGGMTWITQPITDQSSQELQMLFPSTDYLTRARVICSKGDTSDYSENYPFRTLDPDSGCFAPELFFANATMNSITVAWFPTGGTHVVSISSDLINWTDFTVNDNTHTFTGLDEGTEYYVRIRKVCDNNEMSEWSPFVVGQTLKDGESPCPAPEEMDITNLQTTSASFVWNHPPSPNVLGYKIELWNGKGNQLLRSEFSETENYTFEDLISGESYIVRVYSICFNSETGDTMSSEKYAEVDFRTNRISKDCPMVRGFEITQITQFSAKVSWAPVNAAIGYVVEYSMDGGISWMSTPPIQGNNTIIEGLMPGTTYLVRITTLCRNGVQSPSTDHRKFTTLTHNDACPRPKSLTIKQVDGSKETLNVVINDVIDLGGPFGWTVSQNNQIISEGITEQMDFTVFIPNAKGVYQICVVRHCIGIAGIIYSEPTCVDYNADADPDECASPYRITYRPNPDGSVTVMWSVPQPNNVIKFKGTQFAGNKMQTFETEANEFTFKGLIKGMSYTVCVQSVCASASGTAPQVSDTACVTFRIGDDPTNCPTVNGFKIGNITGTTAEIFWAPVPMAIGYIFEYSTDFQNWTSLDVDGNQTSVVLTGLEPGTKYYFRVTTICKNGKSQPSRIEDFVTQKGVSDCPPVTDLKVNRITANSGLLEWKYSNNMPINGFLVTIEGSDGFTASFEIEPNRRSHLFNNLTPNTTYTVTIIVYCIGPDGEPVPSDSVNVVFKTKEGQGQCPKPRELSVNEISFTSAVINWVTAPGVSGYILQYRALPNGPVQTREVSAPPVTLDGLEPGTKYGISLVAVCKSSNGGTIVSDSVVTIFETKKEVNNCPTPTNVKVDSIGENFAVVSWTGSNEARGYEVWLLIGNEWTKVGETTNTFFELTDLAPGKSYQVKIRTGCRESMSEFSKVVKFTTKKKSCPSPQNVTVTNITSNSATVTWTAVPDAFNYTVTYFIDGDPNSLITVTAQNPTINLTGLVPDKKYIVRVRTRCKDQSVSDFTETFFRTEKKPICQTPETTTVSNITTNSAFVTWTAVPGALGYELMYKKLSDPNYTTVIVATNQRTIDGLSDNTFYIFKVVTICADDDKSQPTPDREFKTVQVCGVPTNIVANPINIYDATVTWNAVPGAVSYEIKVVINGSPVNLNSATNSVNITGLTPKATVIVQVRALCGEDNNSVFSPPVTFVTKPLPCNKPENPATISVTTNSAILTWTTVANSVGYEVTVTGPNNYNQTQTVVGPPASFIGMIANSTYTFKVRTLCADNEKSDYVTSTFTTPAFVCPQVTNVTVTNVSQSGAVINWVNPGPGYQYEVSYSVDNGSTYTSLPLTANSNIQITGLAADTQVLVKVKTVCGSDGTSDPVMTEFRTLAAGVCNTPTNLRVTNITVNSALVSWDAVPGAISYQVSYKDVNAAFYTTVNVTPNSRVLSNLTVATDYVVRVRARCAGGVNPFTEWTELRSFTTLSNANVCGTPTIIDAVPTRNSALVSWTSVAGANSYRLAYSTNGGLSFINLAWTPNTSQTISNLPSGKDILVRVRAKCANNSQSPFSSAFLFTTLAARSEDNLVGENTSMTVYPNPTKGAINIAFDGAITGDVVVRLVDQTGREVYTQTLRAEVGHNELPVEFSGVAAGVYNLQLMHNNATRNTRLIIQQ